MSRIGTGSTITAIKLPDLVQNPDAAVRYDKARLPHSVVKPENFFSTISIVIVSAILFLVVFSWFDALRSLFNQTFFPDNTVPESQRFEVFYALLLYAIFITLLGVVLLYIMYHLM